MGKYRYLMIGMFCPTDGEDYEINVPSPFLHDSKEEAMADEQFGYRFVLLNETIGPQLLVFERERFEVETENGRKYLRDLVEGQVIKSYTFEEFKEAGGYIRLLKPGIRGTGFIDSDTDFLDTDRTFRDVFPNMQKQKLYYIDDEAYRIEKL